MNVLVMLCILGSVAPEYTTDTFIVILNTEVEIVDIETVPKGIPVIFANYMGIGANFDFLELPVWAQEALVAHELGHVELGHIYDGPRLDRAMYYPIFETVDPRERDADLYGADLIGVDKMLAMLGHAYDICAKLRAQDCVIEAIIRIEMLHGQYCI